MTPHKLISTNLTSRTWKLVLETNRPTTIPWLLAAGLNPLHLTSEEHRGSQSSWLVQKNSWWMASLQRWSCNTSRTSNMSCHLGWNSLILTLRLLKALILRLLISQAIRASCRSVLMFTWHAPELHDESTWHDPEYQQILPTLSMQGTQHQQSLFLSDETQSVNSTQKKHMKKQKQE